MRIFFVSLLLSCRLWAGYAYCVPVTFNNHPGSTLTDFPAMFCANGSTGAFCDSVAHSNLVVAGFKGTGSGGSVTSANGYDIRPFTDVSCSTAITGFELVTGTYVSATGAFEMWIKIASLASGSDTTIYIGYGNAAVTTDGSSTSTWPSQFKRVYHLPNGSSLGALDSTGSQNCSLFNTPTATAGKLDGGAHFVTASSQYIACSAAGLPTTGSQTATVWLKTTAILDGWMMSWGSGGTSNFFAKGGTQQIAWGDGPGWLVGTAIVNDGAWHYIVGTFNSSGNARKIYVDGVLDASDTHTMTAGTTNFAIATNQNSVGSQLYGGDLDEARVLSTELTAAWVLAEFNNQSAPWNFYTIGTPVASASGAPKRMIVF